VRVPIVGTISEAHDHFSTPQMKRMVPIESLQGEPKEDLDEVYRWLHDMMKEGSRRANSSCHS